MFKRRVNGASRDRVYRASSACIACPDGSPLIPIDGLVTRSSQSNEPRNRKKINLLQHCVHYKSSSTEHLHEKTSNSSSLNVFTRRFQITCLRERMKRILYFVCISIIIICVRSESVCFTIRQQAYLKNTKNSIYIFHILIHHRVFISCSVSIV